ncbi:spore gernimation protein GerPD [Paenibacillus sp. HB172176]|uniref:spore gernimation protein GerPD n=1 Tax=Paenibacillus sp. HB172176 TaxID=2493690 RepID=UPI00197DF383|nr:spore gernimation protein GerPD [Paenibacillus sp. HB172176]
MQFKVINHCLSVGEIDILGLASSSMLQVGDTDQVALYSMFDTPPESVIVGPLAPLPPPEDEEAAIGEI